MVLMSKKFIATLVSQALYEKALRLEKGSAISDVGALLCYSGEKTGRSPKDKRVVRHPYSEKNIDWGPINIELDEHTFMVNRENVLWTT